MPTTLTLKNIPDEVYQQLKAAASTNRRSLNSEAIVRLEASLLACRPCRCWRAPGPRPRIARSTAEGQVQGARHRRCEARGPGVIVVDTSVLAYLNLPTEFSAQAEALLERDADWAAPTCGAASSATS